MPILQNGSLPPPPLRLSARQDASGAPLKPSFAVLAQASSSAKSWPITSAVRAFIDDAVSRTGEGRMLAATFFSHRAAGQAAL